MNNKFTLVDVDLITDINKKTAYTIKTYYTSLQEIRKDLFRKTHGALNPTHIVSIRTDIITVPMYDIQKDETHPYNYEYSVIHMLNGDVYKVDESVYDFSNRIRSIMKE